MTYTLRFPFELPLGQRIDGLDKSREFKVDELTWLFETGPNTGYFAVSIKGLESELACQEYLNRLWSGFNWLTLQKGLAIKAELVFDKVIYVTDPERAARNLERTLHVPYTGPIHGSVNERSPCYYPSDKNIRCFGVGTPTVTIGTSVDDAMEFLREGITIRGDNPTITDQKLQLALELYSAHWYEYSKTAKLLTLILSLESLLTHPSRHELAVQLLEKWSQEVETHKKDLQQDSEEYCALESLERELLFRKEDSLRSQVRSFVHQSLQYLGLEEPVERAKQAVWAYDQRSTLVHEGFLPKQKLNEAISIARSTVGLVLEARYRGFMPQ
jgi:hypothetical protein